MPRHDTTVLRYEAWTLPWSGDFHRVVASIPVVEGSGRGSMHFREVAGEGSMDIDLSNFDRLDDIISDTTGTLIRVFDGTTIIHEWLAERVNRVNDDNHRIASVSGPSLQSSFDKWVVYPWDYPKNPSLQPDWVYGGRNLISNPSFEENADTPTVYTIYTDATTGTFSISDGTDATDPIAFDATPAQLESRLENDLGKITDVLVTGEGTEENRWEIEFQNPPFGVTLSLDSHTLDGDIWIAPTQIGGPSFSPAMKSQTVSVGSGSREYGAYTTFELTTAQAHTGDHSLLIDPAPIPPRYAGVQWVVNVKPGTIHQASVWIRPTSGTNKYRFVVRAPGGGAGSVGAEGMFIDSDTGGLGGTSFPANTWSQITITDLMIPDGVSQIIVRLANVDATGNPAPFYVDDISLIEGFAPSTLGLIATDLLNDASLDHLSDDRGVVLDWVDYSSFDPTNDSSSEAWDQEISVNIPFGFTYGQVWDTFTDLGYEWELVPKASPSATLTHDLHWYNKGNRDDAPPSAINVRQGVTGGSVLKRIPGFNAAIVEAGGGAFQEQTFSSDFGRIETFIAAREAPDDDTLTKLLNEVLEDQATNRVAAQFSLVATHDHSRALVDYRPGDTVAMQMPPNLPKEERRVQQVSYVNNYPTEYVVVGSRVFMGEEAGGWELVRRLWRRFLRRDKDTTQAHPFLGGGGMHIDVAAHNAPSWQKAAARYICDGVDDHIEIQQAIEDRWVESGGSGQYSIAQLSAGEFNVASGWIVVLFAVHLRGMGVVSTVIRNQDAGTGNYQNALIRTSQDSELSNLGFQTSFDHPSFPMGPFVGVLVVNEYAFVHDLNHIGGDARQFIFFRGTIYKAHSLQSWGGYGRHGPATNRGQGIYEPAMFHFDEGWYVVSNVMASIAGTALWIDRFGEAALSNAVIQTNGLVNVEPSLKDPAVVIDNARGLALSNVSIRAPWHAAIEIRSYPFGVVMSNVFMYGKYGISIAAGDGIDSMDISNVLIEATTTGIHTQGQDVDTLSIQGLTIRKASGGGGIPIEPGYGAYFTMTRATATLQIINFNIDGFEEDGLVVEYKESSPPAGPIQISDGRIMNMQKHGMVLEGVRALVHDVFIDKVGLGAANTYDAIQLKGTTSELMLHHNQIRGRSQLRYGINVVDAAVSDAVILDNLIGDDGDYGTAAINDDGTNTTIRFIDGSGSGGGGVGGSSSSKVVFSQAGTLSTGTGTFKLPFTLDAEIISVQLAVATSPTDADLIVDVNKNGTTIFTTQANRPTVPDADANGVGAEAVPDVTAISEGDYLTIDIDQIGSTVAGEDLTVVVEWRPT